MKQETKWILLIVALIIVGSAATLTCTWLQPKNSNKDEPTQSTSQRSGSKEPHVRTFTSAKSVKIELDSWPENGIATNPLIITGKVPGNWSFEGSFPIDVVYEGDIGVPGTTAKIQGDWMTTEMVPFTATLTFDEKVQAGSGVTIILRKDNPSGKPENDDSLALKVRFS